MGKQLIVLKLGGSVITDKASATPKANLDAIRRLAQEASEAYSSGKFDLVIVHGAGSYGHGIVKRTGIDKGITNKEQVLAFAETQKLQNEFNTIVTQELIAAGLPAIPCQASAHAVMCNGRIVNFDMHAVEGMVKIGLVPVLYGVPAFDSEQGCSILSGDQIAPYVAQKLGAAKLIHGTDVDGIFTADPKKDAAAVPIGSITKENMETVRKSLTGSANTDVTGGMWGKVNEIASVGLESQIVSALIPGRVKAALLGEAVGTTIKF